MINKQVILNKLDYILVFLFINLSGNVFFMELNYSVSCIMIFFLTLLVFCYKNNFKIWIDINTMYFIILGIMFILIPMVVYKDSPSSYIALSLQMIIAFMGSKIMDFRRFVTVFINIMLFLSVISLICFFLYQVYPQIALFFPMTPAIASVNYYNAGLYVFQELVGYGRFVATTRNNGVFWEPGAYQAFLNTCLVFFLHFKYNDSKEKYVKTKTIILIITILTTFSSNAYILLAVILITYSKKIFKMRYNTFLLLIIGMIAVALFAIFTGVLETAMVKMFNKFYTEFSNGMQGATIRISLDKIHYLWSEGNLYFWGMSFGRYVEIGESCWNSVIHTALTLGIPFTIMMIYGYYKFSKIFKANFLTIFIVLIFSFFTETLFWRPLFLLMIFYGIKKRKDIDYENIMANKYNIT
ncbi:MAG: hypothetical protein R3Y09_11115 [Clostridia bacterium]